MIARFGTGIRLAKASLVVLRNDRSLAIFPILSTISCMLALALILTPGMLGVDWSAAAESEGSSMPPILYLLGLVAMFVTTFLTIFFNVALASCASRSLDGVDTTVGEGLAAATARLPAILGWSLIAFGVGLILRLLDELADEAPFPLSLLANIGVAILGMAWGAVTFLVVPVLALEQVGPREALTRSKDMIISRWGEGLAGNVGIGLVIALFGFLPAILLIVAGVAIGAAAGMLLVAVGVVVLVLSSIVSATLTQVFAVSLYRYAGTGELSAGFTASDMQQAFRHRKGGRR